MRDHKKLKAFELADQLALTVYGGTQSFPKAELFGLTSQMRRATVSICSNIVEGCARHTEADYLHFLDMAFGSSQELAYQVSLASRLGYVPASAVLVTQCDEFGRVLNGLIRALRNKPKAEGLEP